MDGVCTEYKKQFLFSFFATIEFIPAVWSSSASGDGGQQWAYIVTKEELFFQSLCYCEKVMLELQFPLAFSYLSGLPAEYKPILTAI